MMALTEIYNLRKDFAVKPMSRKILTDVRIYRDHSSMFSVEEKHKRTVLQRNAFPNHKLAEVLAKWQGKGFTLS